MSTDNDDDTLTPEQMAVVDELDDITDAPDGFLTAVRSAKKKDGVHIRDIKAAFSHLKKNDTEQYIKVKPYYDKCNRIRLFTHKSVMKIPQHVTPKVTKSKSGAVAGKSKAAATTLSNNRLSAIFRALDEKRKQRAA